MGITSLVKEARRRRVFSLAALYMAGVWVVLQVADLAFPGLGIDESAIRHVWLGAFVGFPIALFFGWRYDIVGGRVIRTEKADSDTEIELQRSDYLVLAGLAAVAVAVAVGVLLEIYGSRDGNEPIRSASEIDPHSVAVLPFVAMSADENDEYFADGLSEELLNSLANVAGLAVSSRTESFYFKGTSQTMRTIGDTLRVAHVLEGSIRRAGGRLRITAQLIKVSNGYHLWSETYDRNSEDIFEIQTEIATQVADALEVRILDKKDGPRDNFGTYNAEARSGYLIAKARTRRDISYLAPSANYAHVRATRDILEHVVELDPEYADAWALLARIILKQRSILADSQDSAPPLGEDIERVGQSIEKAERFGASSAAIMLAKADQAFWRFAHGAREPSDKQLAIAAFEAAIAAEPLDVDILESAAAFYHRFDMHERALELYERILQLEPLADVRMSMAEILWDEDPVAAYGEIVKTGELHPESGWKGAMYLPEIKLGHYHHALVWSEEIAAQERLRVFLWASLGDFSQALDELELYWPDGGNLGRQLMVWKFYLLRDYAGFQEWLNSDEIKSAAGPSWRLCGNGYAAAFYLRDWDEASRIIEFCLEGADQQVLDLYFGKAGAREIIRDMSVDLRLETARKVASLALVLGQTGRQDEVDRVWQWAGEIIDSTIPTGRRQREKLWHYRALLQAGRGRTEDALYTLERMYESGWRGPLMGWDGKIAPSWGDQGWFEDNPLFDSIREEPRFIAFVDKVKADNARMLEEYRAGLNLDDIIREDLAALGAVNSQ